MARSPDVRDKPYTKEDISALAALQMRFGERFRQARLAAGITQAKAAEQSGIHEQYISKVEKGNSNLTLDTMLRLATVVGHSVSDMLREAETLPKGEAE